MRGRSDRICGCRCPVVRCRLSRADHADTHSHGVGRDRNADTDADAYGHPDASGDEDSPGDDDATQQHHTTADDSPDDNDDGTSRGVRAEAESPTPVAATCARTVPRRASLLRPRHAADLG